MGTTLGVTIFDGHNYTNITTNQGLVNNDVRSILQDRRGNTWMGTLGGGISKYDGKSFSNFTIKDGLSNNSIGAIKEDIKGNIWFGTWGGGIIKYDGFMFTNYSKKQGLVNDSVNALLTVSYGNIWVGTNGGVSKFDGVSFSNYTSAQGLGDKNVYTLLQDRKGRLWIGTIGGGVKIFDGVSFSILNAKNGLIHDDVFSLLEDKKGDIWIGTHYGLSRYDGHSITNYSEKQGLTNANIYCLMHGKVGNIWIGTGGGGALKYNPHSFRHITENDGLKRNYTFSLFEDHSKHLWIGSWRGGVSVLANHTLKTFTKKEGLPDDDIRSVYQDKKGALWFATYHGIVKYDGLSFANITTANGLCDNDVNCISGDHQGNLWIGTENGASKFNGSHFTDYFFSRSKIQVQSIREDRLGNIWFGTSAGVFEFDGKNFYQFGDERGVYNQPVSQIYEDRKNNLWFASAAGLLKYDGKQIIQFTEKEGLINNEISAILEDYLDNIWVGSPGGLCQLTPDKALLFDKKANGGIISDTDVFFTKYRYANDFLGLNVNYRAITETSDHQIWIGTGNGVTTFDPSGKMNKTVTPTIYITAIRIANQEVNWNKLMQNPDTSFILGNGISFQKFRFDSLSGFYNLPRGLELDWKNNDITFECSGIAMEQPQNIKYRYILEGPEHFISGLTDQAFVSYGNLSPGNYIFKAKAMNYNGYWSDEAQFAFRIKSPYWQTWWFKIFASLVIGLLVFFLIRYIYLTDLHKQKAKLENELALQFERQRISTDLHDEIGSTLSSINIYSNLAKTEEIKEPYLDSIAENVADVLHKLDDLVWKINPKYNTVMSVVNRLEAYAVPLTEAKQISLEIAANDSIKSMRMSDETKHNLFLVLKELVNNAVKHSGCKTISLVFEEGKQQLTVIVKDDGSGIDASQSGNQGNGLINISERIKKLKGTVNFKSGNKGTEVLILLPTA